jgi:hypothetical protein
MRTIKINTNFLLLSILIFYLMSFLVFAQTVSDIDYPVAELGNCQNQTECRAYCDNLNHIEACLSFARENNLISQEELKEAEKMSQALRAGAGLPGNCQNKAECDAYCNNPSHLEECLDFAESAGLISSGELREARQMAKALASGVKMPGNCQGKKECEAYCSEPSHMEECFRFAKAAGLIPPEEAAMAEKVIPLMAKGETPGGCKTKEECEAYCGDESHIEECAEFSLKAGLMTAEEEEMFRKTGGKGPGGCKSETECEAFCNNPANQQVCFEFAKKHGLIPEEELQKMNEGIKSLKKGLEMASPEVLECLNSTVGIDTLNKIRAGTLMPSPQIGEQIKNCFEQFMPPEGMPPAGSIPEASE